MEKLFVVVYIIVFLLFCAYIRNFLTQDEEKKPKVNAKEYYKKKYLHHSKMSDKHAKEAQRAFRKYTKLNKSHKGQWR